jgi:hypothetical protein
MKTITLDILNDKVLNILHNLESLELIHLHEGNKNTSKNEKDDSRKEILDNISAGLEEIALYKKGKLKTIAKVDFLNEI